MKTIFVTGGLGFIGSHFVDLAITRGYEVFIIDSMSYAADVDLIPYFSDLGATHIYADIIETDLLGRLYSTYKPEAVFNFAAESHVDNSITNPAIFYRTNCEGVSSLISACKGDSKKFDDDFTFIQVSTDEIYGSLSLQDAPFKIDDNYQPRSPYAASKAAGELVVKAAEETYGLKSIITRCGNNYGPRQHLEKFIPKAIDSAIKGIPYTLYGTGENIRDWVWVKDHVRVILDLYESKKYGVHNIGSCNEKTNLQVLGALKASLKSFDLDLGWETVADRQGHDFRYALDVSGLDANLRINDQFDKNLVETIQWYIEEHRCLKE